MPRFAIIFALLIAYSLFLSTLFTGSIPDRANTVTSNAPCQVVIWDWIRTRRICNCCSRLCYSLLGRSNLSRTAKRGVCTIAGAVLATAAVIVAAVLVGKSSGSATKRGLTKTISVLNHTIPFTDHILNGQTLSNGTGSNFVTIGFSGYAVHATIKRASTTDIISWVIPESMEPTLARVASYVSSSSINLAAVPDTGGNASALSFQNAVQEFATSWVSMTYDQSYGDLRNVANDEGGEEILILMRKRSYRISFQVIETGSTALLLRTRRVVSQLITMTYLVTVQARVGIQIGDIFQHYGGIDNYVMTSISVLRTLEDKAFHENKLLIVREPPNKSNQDANQSYRLRPFSANDLIQNLKSVDIGFLAFCSFFDKYAHYPEIIMMKITIFISKGNLWSIIYVIQARYVRKRVMKVRGQMPGGLLTNMESLLNIVSTPNLNISEFHIQTHSMSQSKPMYFQKQCYSSQNNIIYIYNSIHITCGAVYVIVHDVRTPSVFVLIELRNCKPLKNSWCETTKTSPRDTKIKKNEYNETVCRRAGALLDGRVRTIRFLMMRTHWSRVKGVSCNTANRLSRFCNHVVSYYPSQNATIHLLPTSLRAESLEQQYTTRPLSSSNNRFCCLKSIFINNCKKACESPSLVSCNLQQTAELLMVYYLYICEACYVSRNHDLLSKQCMSTVRAVYVARMRLPKFRSTFPCMPRLCWLVNGVVVV
uniref:Killer toxin KHS n=1 Tax=Saccharomyces cerevisiae TaxID=4932 RepID=KHS1_YEASX|nr:RecName: Full=Killer toxin KHS; AltName: Full=Killer of heat sensitive; Flags: Precursor [Saccharomyces cerevisiae]AAC60532.1 KHS toxin, killer heat sensitive toxin [Saccharomyces cerevisiae]